MRLRAALLFAGALCIIDWRQEASQPDPMTDNPIDTELAAAILAAITEAREHGIPDERIIEMLAEIVKGLREGLS